MENELDHLGKLLMTRLRDVAFECVEGLCENQFDSPGHRAFQRLLASMSPEQREIVRDTVQYWVDCALNDFLFHLDKELRRKNPTLRLEAGGICVTEQTANLQKELYGAAGWKARFSHFREITVK